MGFKDFLLSFFPHRWLDPKSAGNIRLFGGLGLVLDQYDALVSQVKQEMRVSTAVDSIPFREAEYGLPVNPSLPLGVRRSNIMAKMRERGGPITKPDLLNALDAYGIKATLENDYENSVMWIRIDPDYTDVSDFGQIAAFVERVTRAHVGKVWAIPFSVTNQKGIDITVFHRAIVNFWDERALYLDGSWFLDGTYALSGKEITRENNCGMRLTLSNLNQESIGARLITENDLWYLDGTYNLDGTKFLDAEIIEEVL